MPLTRFITLLWHGDEPIGICVFACPARSLKPRSQYFGLTGGWSRARLQALNAQLVTLSRVVLHPVYRGAGLAAEFVRASCEHCDWPWVEALAEMGHLNPFFERAGFVRVGQTGASQQTGGSGSPAHRSRAQHSAIYGGGNHDTTRKRLVSQETFEKSRYAQPVYYIRDNRRRGQPASEGDSVSLTPG